MRRINLYILLAVLFLGTLALVRGTHSLTDVKGPVFVAGALVVTVAAVWSILARGRSPALGRLWWFPAAASAYLAYTAASALWASHPWIVKYVFADRMLMMLLAVAVSIVVARSDSWRTLAGGFVALGAVVAATGLVVRRSYPTAFNDVSLPLGNANLLAAVLLLPLLLAAGFAVREWAGRRRPRVFAAVGVAGVLTLAVFALCRGVSYWIGLGAGAAAFAALRSRRPLAIVGAAVILAAALGAVGWKAGAVERFKQTKSYIVRAELWRRAAHMVAERPVLGWGAGNFFTDNQPFAAERAMEVLRYHEGGATKDEPTYKILTPAEVHVHNEYLQQFVEGGVVGLALYLALFAAAGASAFHARRRGFAESALLDAGLAALAGYLVSNAFNPEVYFADFGPYFWILTGAVAGAGLQVEEQTPVRASLLRMRGPIIAAAVILAGYGVYTFAVKDYQSSLAYKRGDTLYRQRDFLAAAPEYVAAAERTWDAKLREQSNYTAGICYLATGQEESAYTLLEKTSGEITALLDTDYWVGDLLERAGAYEKALEHYRLDLAGHPEHAKTPARIKLVEALLALKEGHVEEGLLRGRDYVEQFGDDRAGRRAFVRALVDPEIRRLAELDIEKSALADSKADAEDLFLAGTIEYLNGKVAPAVDLLEKSRAGGYAQRDLFYLLGRAYDEAGRREDALKTVAEGRRLFPTCRGLRDLERTLSPTGAAGLERSADKP